jgi:hypothetical protein
MSFLCCDAWVSFWPLTSFRALQKCGRYRINSGQTAPSDLTGSAAFDPDRTSATLPHRLGWAVGRHHILLFRIDSHEHTAAGIAPTKPNTKTSLVPAQATVRTETP